jgi:hypothetical protein
LSSPSNSQNRRNSFIAIEIKSYKKWHNSFASRVTIEVEISEQPLFVIPEGNLRLFLGSIQSSGLDRIFLGFFELPKPFAGRFCPQVTWQHDFADEPASKSHCRTNLPLSS